MTPLRTILVVFAATYSLIAVLLSVPSCTRGAADTRVRVALDVLADVVDPAYSLAVDGCIARQEAVAERASAGAVRADEAVRELVAIRARCARVRGAFDAIRALHEQAIQAVEAGQLSRAEDALAALRARWRELREAL